MKKSSHLLSRNLDVVTLQHAEREQMNELHATSGIHSCVDNSLQLDGYTQPTTASQPFKTAHQAIETVSEILVDQSTDESMNRPSRLREPHILYNAIPYSAELPLDII